jgi:hypothetical protein
MISTHGDTSSSAWVGRNSQDTLGKTVFQKLLIGKTGLYEHRCLWIPTPSLKLQSFLDNKHLHSAWALADVASI